MEEKFRKAMVANAGLDNEKAQLTYQVDLLKDQLEETEEQSALVSKELREKSRDFELMKRSYAEAQRAVQLLQVKKIIKFYISYILYHKNLYVLEQQGLTKITLPLKPPFRRRTVGLRGS